MQSEFPEERGGSRRGIGRIFLWIICLLVLGALAWFIFDLVCKQKDADGGQSSKAGFTVNFVNGDGGALPIPSQTIPMGGKVVQPEAPAVTYFVFSKPGLYADGGQYSFDGWRNNEGGKWDFAVHTVTKDTTLFAVWNGPEPISGVAVNDLAQAMNYVNAKPGRYILAIDADISAGTQSFPAQQAGLRIVGLGKTRAIAYTGGGNGTLFSPRANSGTLTIGTNIILNNLAAMQDIRAGSFMMGSPVSEKNLGRKNDETQHRVQITKNFSIGKYPVTQELYRFVMGENPSRFQQTAPQGERAERRPVDTVCFYDTLVFCNRLSRLEGLTPVYRINGSADPSDWGKTPANYNDAWNAVTMDMWVNGYRLPTEAEWEYACRAGTTTAYNTGAGVSDATGWYAGNSKNTTHETGLKSANAWGLYDTHGNVYEWCWDWWAPFADKDEMDSTGPASSPIKRRVMRGAAWKSPSTLIRSAYRDYGDPFHKCTADGFRLVRSAQNAQ